MSNIEARVGALEVDMRAMRDDLATIKATYATRDNVGEVRIELEKVRAELHSSLRQQTMWSVGTIIAMAGLVFAIMRFLPSAA